MEQRDILIEALREKGGEPTEDEIVRLDADVTKIVHILFDYYLDQTRHGRKITDPYPEDDKPHERSYILSSIDKRAGGRNKPRNTT